MAEPTQFDYTLKEVGIALLKQGGIKEGLWVIGFEFQFGAILAGPDPDDSMPTGAVGISKLLLRKADPTEDGSPKNLTIDASLIYQTAAQPAAEAPKRAAKRKASTQSES